jgi:tRNA dimethylallyltransferase
VGLTPLIVVLGPTASGKTALALELAARLTGEIVNADSRQTVRGMDIGTAKPTPEQRARIPHHLLDISAPDETLTLAQVQALAYTAIDKITARGRLPFLVGGTGQYITAITEGWMIPPVPPNDALRAQLEAFAAAHGHAALSDRLHALDAAAAAAIDPRNIRRVIRAIEVTLATGRPFSAQRSGTPPPYRILTIGLRLERPSLFFRADARLNEMLRAGFVDEVRGLLAAGYDRHLPSFSALGYPQLIAHLLDGVPLADAVDATHAATRAYIKRQMTWFNGHDRGILWQDASVVDAAALEGTITRWLNDEDA